MLGQILGVFLLISPTLGAVVTGRDDNLKPAAPPNNVGCVCQLQQTCPTNEALNDQILELLQQNSQLLRNCSKWHQEVPTPENPDRTTENPDSSDQDMKMIFRASAGSGAVTLYYLWTSDQSMNTNNPELLTVNNSVKGVYKSALVDEDWDSIEEVKVVLYKAGLEVVNMVFSAVNTNKMTWFGASHLVSSSYTDLKTTSHNFFSIAGHNDRPRRFFIQHSYAGCNGDIGWFIVIDSIITHHDCVWERPDQSERPVFLYSPGNTKGLNKDMQAGDVLVFYAKLKPQ